MPCGTICHWSSSFSENPDQPASPRFEPIGTRDMFSIPAATTRSRCPAWIADAAFIAACIDEPHWRSTVVAHTVSGQPGDQRGDAPDVQRLLADLRDAAHLDVLDRSGIEVESLHQPVQHLRGQLVGPHRRERAVPLADRAADGVDDQGVAHRLAVNLPHRISDRHAPRPRDALQRRDAAVVERQPGAGHEVLHRLRDEHLAGRRPRPPPAPRSRRRCLSTLSSSTSHSPVCSPARSSSPSSATASRIAQAHRIARAGPSKRAKNPSPAVSSSTPR